MRKSVLLLFITLSTITYGQSLMVVEQDTIVEINSTSVSDYGFHIKVKNTSSEDLDVYVRRAYANPTCAYDCVTKNIGRLKWKPI